MESFPLLISISGGLLTGLASTLIYQRVKLRGFNSLAANIIEKAEDESQTLRKKADLQIQQERLDHQKELDRYRQEEKRKLDRELERFAEREDKLDKKTLILDEKIADLEKREKHLTRALAELAEAKECTAKAQQQLYEELEQVSGWSCTEARHQFLSRIETECKTDAANMVRRIHKEAQEEADRLATTVVATAICRLAAPCVSESTVNCVTLPNDEMKGRIIGREGRNIRTLEKETGVTFVIDDTPGAVVLSSFDPVRLHIAKLALTDLIADGRIHPTRIEEAVEKSRTTIERQIKQHGEDAALRAGAVDLHPELITLLGKLKFRTSYGQNILEHSIEVAHIMGLMASELGLDVALAKRIGLLHDMGKAVTHEIEGSHAIIGHDLALKYGESQEVANGIGCHHNEIPPSTIEGSLCGAADAVSASRPGARIEAVEEYIKRLRRLEEIANSFDGVHQAYALQAGREVRVIVLPEVIDDAGTVLLARNLSKQIEKELRYPGKIKITVIREKRVTEYAL
jgi:ribonuclease Y